MLSLITGAAGWLALKVLRGRVSPDKADAIIGSKLFAGAAIVLAIVAALGIGAVGIIIYGHAVESGAFAQCKAEIQVKALKAQLEAEAADKKLAERQRDDRTKALERIEAENQELGELLKELRNAKSREDADPVLIPGDDPWLLGKASGRRTRASSR